MDIGTLRELRQHLIDYTEYLPPDDASNTIWEQAVERAEKAQDRLDDLGPVLALLDAIDILTERVTMLEKTTMCICLDCERGDEGWCPNSQKRGNHDR